MDLSFISNNKEVILKLEKIYNELFSVEARNEYFPHYSKERKNMIFEIMSTMEIKEGILVLLQNDTVELISKVTNVSKTYQEELISVMNEGKIEDMISQFKKEKPLMTDSSMGTQDDCMSSYMKNPKEFITTHCITSKEAFVEVMRSKYGNQIEIQDDWYPECFKEISEDLDRAISSLKDHLSQIAEYDVEGWQVSDQMETRNIIFGVKKRNANVNIIARPAGETTVAIVKKNELALLRLSNTELWVDNGKGCIKQLTLANAVGQICNIDLPNEIEPAHGPLNLTIID